MKFGATNKPGTCKWCGRNLRWRTWTVYENTDKKPKKCAGTQNWKGDKEPCGSTEFTRDMPGWICSDGHHLSAIRRVKERTRFHDKPGANGDGHFCGVTCGYNFGVAMAGFGRLLQPRAESES